MYLSLLLVLEASARCIGATKTHIGTLRRREKFISTSSVSRGPP